MDMALRAEIQNDLFAGDMNKFYRYCWHSRPHVCEETMQPLNAYSAVHISHILSRGAHPEMAFDPRNVNILSFPAHQTWETGNRKGMRIYELNLIIIKILKDDYKKS